MKQLMSLPLSGSTLTEYPDLDALCQESGCDGLEAIWSGEPLPTGVPPERCVGYHLAFFPDWLDFWLGDEAALRRKFGTAAVWREFYGGDNGRETLLAFYRDDLERATSWGAQYVVFHVSDVSLTEAYTYRWEHTHEQVLDASAELINCLLGQQNWPFAFLMENQWWSGLTLTDPAQTRRLLDAVQFPGKGLLLDIGHLMNTEPNLRTQEEAVSYLHGILDAHEDLLPYVKGVHLHQSLSGAYVKTHTGTLPSDWAQESDYLHRFSRCYEHILQIDTHLPLTCPNIVTILDRIQPDWLVHELFGGDLKTTLARVHQQINTLRKGWKQI